VTSLLGLRYCKSVCLLSICNVRAPYTQGVQLFRNKLISSPQCTLAILWPPRKILRRSSQAKPSVRGV